MAAKDDRDIRTLRRLIGGWADQAAWFAELDALSPDVLAFLQDRDATELAAILLYVTGEVAEELDDLNKGFQSDDDVMGGGETD